MSELNALQELQQSCQDCRNCRLCEGRKNVVFGMGNPNARVMFVGEGPGATEDEQGLPFVGKAGQLLDRFLFAIDLTREDVYIANIVKCRPPQNRDPQPDEQDACIPYLREQVKLIKPQLIVCLGRIAAQRLIREDFRVTREHGKLFDKGAFQMMGTFHPAALLRNPAQNEAAFSDFCVIREFLQQENQ